MNETSKNVLLSTDAFLLFSYTSNQPIKQKPWLLKLITNQLRLSYDIGSVQRACWLDQLFPRLDRFDLEVEADEGEDHALQILDQVIEAPE